jgi:hypothetical protein
LAIPAAAPAMPPNPKTAAISAITKNAIAQFNIANSSLRAASLQEKALPTTREKFSYFLHQATSTTPGAACNFREGVYAGS